MDRMQQYHNLVNRLVDEQLKKSGVEPEFQDTYTLNQRLDYMRSLDPEKDKNNIVLIADNVYKNRIRMRSNTFSNANATTSGSPLQYFLETLLDDASKYVQAQKYDPLFMHILKKVDDAPKLESYESLATYELYEDTKKQALDGLLSGLYYRGVNKDVIADKPHTNHHIMNTKRYEYLSDIATSFFQSIESPEVIDFLKSLPSSPENKIIVLACDDQDDFKKYESKVSLEAFTPENIFEDI